MTFIDDTGENLKGISDVGNSFTIKHALLIDGLKYNLLFISQLCDRGNM